MLVGKPYLIVKKDIPFKSAIDKNWFWSNLFKNPNPILIELIEQSIPSIDMQYYMWLDLGENPNTFYLLEKYHQNLKNYGCLNIRTPHVDYIEKNLHHFNGHEWRCLSLNPHAIPILEKHLDKIEWSNLCYNPNAIHLIEKYPEKIEWDSLSLNPNAIHILEQNIDKINWDCLSHNINAIHILEQNIDKIDWKHFSYNKNANPVLEKHLNKVDWAMICYNNNACDLIEKNIDRLDHQVCWNILCRYNENAIHIIEKHLDKIDWTGLCHNSNAVHLLEKNIDKIDYPHISCNPNAIHLFTTLDYEKMKENMKEFHKELVEYVFNPKRLIRLSIEYHIDFQTLNELY
jgi:hypothetical protein